LEEFFQAAKKTAPLPQPSPVETARRPALTVERQEKAPAVSFSVSVRAGDREDAAPRPRNRLVFAFLAICAGFVGLHSFYARQWLTGLLQLLLSVATTLMGFGFIASWIWAMIEALVVRTDGAGIEMS
jgi:TM2 domain-containing membrane protein YozV